MAIQWNENEQLFALHTKHTSYLMAVADQAYLGHVYYGRRLSKAQGSYLLRTKEGALVPSVRAREKLSFLNSFPMEYPSFGTGDFRETCLVVRTAAGHRACELHYDSYQILPGKPKLEGLPASFGTESDCQTLAIVLKDAVIGLKATLLYSCFEDTDVVTRSVILENESDQPLYLEQVLSTCLNLENDKNFEMITLSGTWGRERNPIRRPIVRGRQGVSSARGESSHQENPFLALVSEGTNQEMGEAYGFNFVYSGNFLAQAEVSQSEDVRVIMGINPEGFEWKLNPGKCFTAPEVVMVYSAQGIGRMSRTYHDFYRRHLIRSPYLNKERPILINNWEATYFNFNTEKLIAIAKEAKSCGIEMLVMDDGWFGKRNDDNSSLGDWKVNEEKLPGGLKYLVDQVNAVGMKFGIWFEPEMISPDSDLYRAHPDWAIQVPGREPSLCRNQLVLDLSRKEIRDYVYESVAAVLRSANIEYVKWDMNRQLSDVGSFGLAPDCQGELYHRYVLGVYELQERLITEFPNLLLENCSGGGARFDPGMLYYSPQIWCSDDMDIAERLVIQEGTAICYPLSCMGAHVGASPCHTTGRVTSFETRGITALAGTFGYELDVTAIPKEDRDQIPGQCEAYHKYHPLIASGDYYRIASYYENHTWDCWEIVSKDQSEALVTCVEVWNRPNYPSRTIRLQGLIPDAMYCLEGTDEVYPGDLLMYGGYLQKRAFGDQKGTLLHFVRCSEE